MNGEVVIRIGKTGYKKAKDLLLFVSCFFSRFEKILNSNNDDNDQVRSPSNPVSEHPLLCLSDLKGPPSVFCRVKGSIQMVFPDKKKVLERINKL